MLIKLKFDGQQLQTHSGPIPHPLPLSPHFSLLFSAHLVQNLLAFCQSHSLEKRANG